MDYQIKCRCGRPLYVSDQPPQRKRKAKRNSQEYRFDVEQLGTAYEVPPDEMPKLSEGEKRVREHFENETVEHVKVKMLRTVPYCGFSTLLSIPVPFVFSVVPWWVPIMVLPATGLVAWAIIDWKGFAPLIDKERSRRSGKLPPGVTEREEGGYNVEGKIKNGRTTIYTTFKISNPWAWHHFCKDVHGGANFSHRVAKARGIEPLTFKKIVEQWASIDPKRQLIDPKSVSPRKKLVLTRNGGLMVKAFALTPPQAAA